MENKARRALLLEQADTLSAAKSAGESVMQTYPEEAYGSGWLEEAIALIGRAESEIDAAAEDLES